MRAVPRAAAWLVLAIVTTGAQCHRTTGPGVPEPLVQTLVIEPPAARNGEVVRVRSEITNRGWRTERATYRICYMPYGGTLAVESAVPVRCAAGSVRQDLVPGQTVVFEEQVVIRSQPGEYVLEVPHLIEPARTGRVTFLVAAPR